VQHKSNEHELMQKYSEQEAQEKQLTAYIEQLNSEN